MTSPTKGTETADLIDELRRVGSSVAVNGARRIMDKTLSTEGALLHKAADALTSNAEEIAGLKGEVERRIEDGVAVGCLHVRASQQARRAEFLLALMAACAEEDRFFLNGLSNGWRNRALVAESVAQSLSSENEGLRRAIKLARGLLLYPLREHLDDHAHLNTDGLLAVADTLLAVEPELIKPDRAALSLPVQGKDQGAALAESAAVGSLPALPPDQHSDGKIAYRGWWISYDPPPIPVRSCDWHFWHDDFDGAPDANDSRHGHAPSLEDAKSQIDDCEDDR